MTNHQRGMAAENLVCQSLAMQGWQIHGRRMRTPLGEVDAVAEKDGLLTFIEVKARPTLEGAATCVAPKQQQRLMEAADFLLGQNPTWGEAGVRFDVVLVDRQNNMRRIKDALRQN